MMTKPIDDRQRWSKEMKPNLDGVGGGSILDHVIESLARRGAESGPYIPRVAPRWNATIVEFPVRSWDQDRRRVLAKQAMELALQAKQECGK
jgi:hypothetical protein